METTNIAIPMNPAINFDNSTAYINFCMQDWASSTHYNKVIQIVSLNKRNVHTELLCNTRIY